jgi:hypothetical protein
LTFCYRSARGLCDRPGNGGGDAPCPTAQLGRYADAQKNEIEELLGSAEVVSLLAAPAPDATKAADLKSARAYAARVALEALQAGYAKGFAAGLENDARLFGAVTNSHSRQYWIERFLKKDPRQSAMLTLLTPT